MRGGCSGPRAIIGLSINNVALAEAAPLDLFDYVGVGGVYAYDVEGQPIRRSVSTGLPAIVEVLRRAQRRFPICGIAGIDATQRGRR